MNVELVHIYKQRGDDDKATEATEKALDYAKKWGELAPDDPEVRNMIGELHLRTGGEDEALAEMEKVLEVLDRDLEVLDRDPEVRNMIDKSHLDVEDEALQKKLAEREKKLANYYATLENWRVCISKEAMMIKPLMPTKNCIKMMSRAFSFWKRPLNWARV